MEGTRVAQSVKHPTSAQVMISQFVSSSPSSGSVLTLRAWNLLRILCLPLSLPLLLYQKKNVDTTQINLHIQCNPYQSNTSILHRARTNNPQICMEPQKDPEEPK